MEDNDNTIQSFEVTGGETSGDLLSAPHGDRQLRVGVLTCAYFEYWRMYPGLMDQVANDMKKIADRIGEKYDVVYPGLVDTLDSADAAGIQFAERRIDLLIIAEGTYCTDYIVHQTLLHLPTDIPLCLFASQAHTVLDFDAGYDQSLRNSGPMGIVQLGAGFRKMGKYPAYEVVVGGVDDDDAYADISRFIDVRTTIHNLKHWNIGLIGHVFRGMYDFQYDKTAVTGKLGPHVIDIDIRHLTSILDEISLDDEQVVSLKNHVLSEYDVRDLDDIDILRSARLSLALKRFADQYKLDGLALLGQHHIELQANSTCYLGLSELLKSDTVAAVTEGDVLGLIMSKVLKDFTGVTPFFGEWEEIDTELNAIMFLGHGFIDPRFARKDRKVRVQPASENWGFEGNSLGFQATYEPGPVTLTHVIQDAQGWRLLISEGKILDTPPMEIAESSCVVGFETDVKRYFRDVIKIGFAHHAIIVPGCVSDHLKCFADQLHIQACEL